MKKNVWKEICLVIRQGAGRRRSRQLRRPEDDAVYGEKISRSCHFWLGRVLALCLTLCLSGTAVAAEGKAAMGRYVEAPLDTSGAAWSAFAGVSGTIYAVDESGDRLLKSLDLNANNWDELETGHDEQTAPAQNSVTGLAVGADGALYLSGWAMRNEDGFPYIERIKDGVSERVQLDQKPDTNSDRLEMCALPSDELLVLSNTEVYRFSADGVTLQKYAVPGGTSMAVYGNELAVCSVRNSVITVLDLSSGQALRTLPLPGASNYGAIGYDANGALYCVCPEGLYQVNANSEMLMQIADGRLMTAGKPSVGVQALMFDEANNPVIAYWQGSGLSLIAYRYDENVATEPSTVLSVFTLYESSTLRECANKFGQKNPDVLVDIIVALPEGTAITRDDAIRTLNTEVLAGRGPDVLVLDGLPVQSYIDKGVLQDLAPAVQPLIDSGALLGNIAGAFQAGDVIPAVPTRFLLPSIWGEVADMHTLEDMAAWAQANPDALPYYAADVEPLIGTFYLSCAPAWFTGDGRLDEAKIEAFLTALKTIRGGWTYEASVQKTGYDLKAYVKEEGLQMPEWNPYVAKSLMSGSGESFGATLMMQGLQKQLPYILRDADSASEVNGQMKASDLSDRQFAPLPGQADGCFLPAQMMAASKGAANAEAALAFIGYALGEESQSVEMDEGFPVNAQVLDTLLAYDDMNGAHTGWGGGNETFQWNATWLDAAQRDRLRSIISALHTPVIPDFTLFQMLVSESTPFFEGAIDAKQAAANVCAKANAYLSE